MEDRKIGRLEEWRKGRAGWLGVVVSASLAVFGPVRAEETGGSGPPAPPSAAESGAKPPLPLIRPPMPSAGDVLGSVLASFPATNREEVTRFVQEHFAGEVARFKEMSRRQLGDAVEYITGVVKDAIDLMDLRRRDPALYEAHMRCRDLEKLVASQAEACRRSSGEERERNIEKLRSSLSNAFDAKQEMMAADVKNMEKELERLKALVDRRQGNREAIISRRLSREMGETEGLEW